jgi:hypothetical protein
MNIAKRLFHIVHLFNKEKKLNEATQKREPIGWQYLFRGPWNGNMFTRYNARKHFRDSSCPFPEESRKLNRRMPHDYILVTWEASRVGKTEANRLKEQGLNILTCPGYSGPDMVFCFGWTRDGQYKAVYSTHAVTLADIGWHSKLTSIADAIKFEKYIGRSLAPHLFEIEGHVDAFFGDEMDVTLENGAKLKVAFRPKSIYNDGILAISPRGAQMLAGIEDPKDGQCFGVTVETGTPHGFAKGHAMVIPWLKYDLVIYDTKPLLRGTEGKFWFGLLRHLHVGEPYLDVQTLINTCGATPAGLKLIARKVDEANRRTLRDIQDFDSLETRFLARTRDKDDSEITWMVERAAQLNIQPVFGALFRSFSNPEMHELRSMPKGRIPIYDEAVYRYVAPEPWIIRADGHIDPKLSRLKGNSAFTHGVIGKAAMWRQPNGTSRERWVIDLVDAGKFMDWGEANVVYLGAEIIPEICAKLGTMDFDDSVIMTTSPEFVELFQNLPEFPEPKTPRSTLADPIEEYNEYEDEITVVSAPETWSYDWFDQRMGMELENRGVGFLANALMCLIILMNGREGLVTDLTVQFAAEPDEAKSKDLLRRAHNMQTWTPPDLLLHLGVGYNDFIDMLKTGKSMGDVSALYKAIDEFYQDIADNLAFPWLWTIGGFDGRGRIPARFRKTGDPVIAKTELCEQLIETAETIKKVEAVLLKLEWRLCIPLPAEVKAKFPAGDEEKKWVSELRSWLYTEWENARALGNIEGVDDGAFSATYKRICDQLEETLVLCPYDLRVIWTELASRIYTQKWVVPPRNNQGKYYHMYDRVCWMGAMAHVGLDALRDSGLAGVRERVALDPGFRHLSGPFNVHVKSTGGVITLARDGRVIGGGNIGDGDWTMHQGMVLVKPASPILRITDKAKSSALADAAVPEEVVAEPEQPASYEAFGMTLNAKDFMAIGTEVAPPDEE